MACDDATDMQLTDREVVFGFLNTLNELRRRHGADLREVAGSAVQRRRR
jgi:hypothetical protein